MISVSKRPTLILATGLFVLAVLLYANTLSAPFQMDDIPDIVRNHSIKHLGDIESIWQFSHPRLINTLSFAVNYHFFGLNVTVFHLTNILLHLFNVMLVFHFANLLMTLSFKGGEIQQARRVEVAFGAALLFLVHPLQTSAVSYLIQRAAVLTTTFYLLAMISYVRYRQSQKMRYYLCMFVSILLAMYTKQIAFMLPFAILLIEFCLLRPSPHMKQNNLMLVPIVLMLMIIPAKQGLRFAPGMIEHALRMTDYAESVSRYHYFLTQFHVIVTYLRLSVLPIFQNFDYDYPIYKHFWEASTLLSLSLLLGLITLAIYLWRKQPFISFGILFFFIGMIPESSFFPLEDVIEEYRMYLPLVGLSIAGSVALHRRIPHQRSWRVSLAVIALSFSFLTLARNDLWSDPVRFMKDVVKKSPRKSRPHNNLGILYLRHDRLDQAENEFKQAIILNPNYAPGYQNLGNVLFSRGEYEGAKQMFEKTISLKTKLAEPHLYLGHLYRNEGDLDKAEAYYHDAILYNSHLVSPYNGLVKVWLMRGNLERAHQMAQEAVYINPDSAVAHYLLGNIYYYTRQLHAAEKSFERAIALNPKLKSARNNMGIIQFELGMYDQSRRHFENALAIDPQFGDAHFNLANAYHALNRFQEADRQLKLALADAKANQNNALVEKIEAFYSGKPIKQRKVIHAMATDSLENAEIVYSL